ncbi:MAG: cold shock domain-containing protein [Bacilli bacterium]|nr:cold shock domain-containing protein [Staphylococcus sp.]
MEGILKVLNTSKGYGFINETITKTNYFVHFSGILVIIKNIH